MTPDLVAGLRALAEALPAGTAVPVPRELLLELLAGHEAAGQTAATPPADFTVAQVADRFGRAASTVRGWVASKQLAGAYHFKGRELRIPAAAVLGFEAQQRAAPPPPRRRKPKRQRQSDRPNLGGWRKEMGP